MGYTSFVTQRAGLSDIGMMKALCGCQKANGVGIACEAYNESVTTRIANPFPHGGYSGSRPAPEPETAHRVFMVAAG